MSHKYDIEIIIPRKPYQKRTGKRLPNARRRRKMLKASGLYQVAKQYIDEREKNFSEREQRLLAMLNDDYDQRGEV